MTAPGLWAYHSGRQSLVFLDPDNPGQGTGWHVNQLVAAGWHATEDSLRRSLPRLDAPALQVAPAAALKALEQRRRR